MYLAQSRAPWSWVTRETPSVCDEWFVDDGQVFVRPWAFDGWLRAFDAALVSLGASRDCDAHGEEKRSAQLLCPPERTREFLATTQSPSSAKTRAPPRWSPPLTLVSKSTHAPGSRCPPATKCSRLTAVCRRVQAHVPHAHQRRRLRS